MGGRRPKINDCRTLANIVSPHYAAGIKAVILKRRKQKAHEKESFTGPLTQNSHQNNWPESR
jgi:hypothetical protein